jgi:hypothetical protein
MSAQHRPYDLGRFPWFWRGLGRLVYFSWITRVLSAITARDVACYLLGATTVLMMSLAPMLMRCVRLWRLL